MNTCLITAGTVFSHLAKNTFRFLQMNIFRIFFLLFYTLSPFLVQSKQPSLPGHYVCYRTDTPLKIDGKATESCWQKAPWTEDFRDILGSLGQTPRLRTRAKMLWDNNFLYVFAEICEPHIWANVTRRDDVIFQDNDFEVFIDPDGDTHNYYEYEMNALNTQWDLRLTRPYRDGGIAITSWNFEGMLSAVNLEGTINNPSDTDRSWSVEIAFPMKSFRDSTGVIPVKPGDQWRINFSRVEWQILIENGHYMKKPNTRTGRPLPEDNWVWSPQGTVNMHCPEKWGYLQFSDQMAGTGITTFLPNPEEVVKEELRNLYYAQGKYKSHYQQFAESLNQLANVDQNLLKVKFHPLIRITPKGYEITAKLDQSFLTWHINETGRVWADRVQ